MAALILIVDDDPVQRRLLESMARRFGYEAETANWVRTVSLGWKRRTGPRSI